ncbi:MAG: BatA and WFA domain-containing protein [Planctomycetales bacterium]|nr:BatA and WFA domain-containing protein [Planctomycetales bacterium]
MFLHPILLGIGLAAASIPVWVHFLTRPRPIRMPLSTIRFVQDALQQQNRRHRLRDILVLAARCAAVGLLAAAMARPLLMSQQDLKSAADAQIVRIVVLDASQSMSAIDGQATRFDAAKAAASKHLGYRPKLAANLFIASSHPGNVFDTPSSNIKLLSQRLAEAQVSAAAIDVTSMLEAVSRQLGSAPAGASMQVIIVSDFQRSNWSRADFAVLPQTTDVELVSVAGAEPPANVAIHSVRLSSSPTAGKPLSLLVDIANHSDDTRTVNCRLQMQSVAENSQQTISARSTATCVMPITWQNEGWRWGNVWLVDNEDAMPGDDEFPIVVGVRPDTSMAIITEASPAYRGGAFFLSEMLLPSSADATEMDDAQTSARVIRVSPRELDTPEVAGSDLWIMSEMETWQPEFTGRVASWLQRGGSLLYVARDSSDANNLEALRQSMGTGFQPPVQLIASLESNSRSDLKVDSFDTLNAPFRSFADRADEAVAHWRIGGGLPTRRTEAGSVDAISATLSDRSVLLFFADAGAGRIAVLNADMARSNLGYHAAFVPLVIETIGRLTDKRQSVAPSVAGRAIVRELPSGVDSINDLKVLRDSDAASDVSVVAGNIVARDRSLMWNWPSPDTPGVYRIVNERGDTLWAEGVCSDPIEQDLRSLSADVLQTRLSGGRDVQLVLASDDVRQTDHLWVWAVLSMLGCIVAEFWTLFTFRS